ncbi:hypothetical protein D3C85_1534190 [compost metagenome]
MLLAGEKAEGRETFFCDVEHTFARRFRVIAETLKVILDAGDHVGEVVQFLPTRLTRLKQQMLANEVIAGLDQARRTAQRNHRQRATYLGQQGR